MQHLHMHRVFPMYIAAKNPTQLAAISLRSNCNLLTTHTHSEGEKRKSQQTFPWRYPAINIAVFSLSFDYTYFMSIYHMYRIYIVRI